MKQSNATDKQCIEKIIKYVNGISECFAHFHIQNPEDLKASFLAQLAITQLITNIYETKKYMRQITLANMAKFDTIKLMAARNLASHDYEGVDFKVIYDLCMQLMGKQVKEVLSHEYNKL